MPTVAVTMLNIESVIEGHGIVLLDFWASWCGPCRTFDAVYQKAAQQHPEMVFGKIDVEEQVELASAFQVNSVPTLMAFRDGILVFSQVGMLPEEAMNELITKILALDMEFVKREMAREEQEKKMAIA